MLERGHSRPMRPHEDRVHDSRTRLGGTLPGKDSRFEFFLGLTARAQRPLSASEDSTKVSGQRTLHCSISLPGSSLHMSP